MRVLAFRHAKGEDLGVIREVLEARTIEVECVDLYAGAPMPGTSAAAGLIFMGGGMCANDGLEFLRQELDTIAAAADRGQPVFGVCLGAQLIAKALGGSVYRNPAPETGWLNIELTADAAADPIFSRLPRVQSVFQLHGDTFDLPPGATLLATSDLCAHQAFRRGKSIYGVQFHPEMTPTMIEEWRTEFSLPAFETPAGACSNLARMAATIFGGWADLLG
jgi:GMP synthase (glutamine-hydrolysing)